MDGDLDFDIDELDLENLDDLVLLTDDFKTKEEKEKIFKNEANKEYITAIKSVKDKYLEIKHPVWMDMLFYNPSLLKDVISHPEGTYSNDAIEDKGGFYELFHVHNWKYINMPVSVTKTLQCAINSGFDMFIQLYFLHMIYIHKEVQKLIQLQFRSAQRHKDLEFFKNNFVTYVKKLFLVMFKRTRFDVKHAALIIRFIVMKSFIYWDTRNEIHMEHLKNFELYEKAERKDLLDKTAKEKKERKQKYQKKRTEEKTLQERMRNMNRRTCMKKEFDEMTKDI